MLHTMSTAPGAPAGRERVTAVTGNHCPVSGTWEPAGEEGGRRRLLEGTVMPAFRNSAAQWKLLEGLRRRDLRS
ncbi:MAG TPA: hypothetical protein VJS86_13595 [Arthrobacter sp.]|nr:hypothetical protein [Arthrobacter sp.]